MEVRVKGLEARIELLENTVEKLISSIPPEKHKAKGCKI
jgi:hypothetical protein